jgi:hypothetical protein
MNQDEARGVLLEILGGYRERTYKEMAGLVGSSEQVERAGPSGTMYLVEIDVFWDNPRKVGDVVRVMGSADDGGLLAALSPVTESILVGPDGVWSGE